MTAQVIERKGLDDVQLHFVDNMEMVGKFATWLSERHENDFIACDTETGGLEFWKQPLRLVQFGDTMQGWAIPWERWGGAAVEVLQKYTGRLGFHNSPFDAKFIEHHMGIKLPWHQVEDTLVMAHILDPTNPVGLKPLGSRFVDAKAVASQRMLDEAMSDKKWTWATVPVDFPMYWIYGAMDTVITSRLNAIFKPKIDAGYAELYDLEMATRRIIAGMEARGARIDIPYVERKQKELVEYVENCRTWVLNNHGIHIGSNQKVGQRMIELGYQLTETTNSGQWKLDKEVLQGIIGLDDRDNRLINVERTPAVVLAELVYAARKSDKIRSTYMDNFLTMHDNGFLHPSINTLGARTGRMSVTNPALQTLPRGDVVRNAFIPREGNSLISIDYDQIELRLITHFAQDTGLRDAFMSGDDFFTTVAREIYGDPDLDKKDPRRQLTKNCMYAKGYGAGVEKMAKTAKVPFDVMKGVADGLDRRFPGIRALQHKVEQQAMGRLNTEGEAYIIDPFGRRQVADQDKVYGLVNSLVQGTAAGILKKALVNMDLMGLGDYLILPIHDEVMLDVPKDDIEEALPIIKEAMTSVGEWMVPLTAEPSVMDRWSK